MSDVELSAFPSQKKDKKDEKREKDGRGKENHGRASSRDTNNKKGPSPLPLQSRSALSELPPIASSPTSKNKDQKKSATTAELPVVSEMPTTSLLTAVRNRRAAASGGTGGGGGGGVNDGDHGGGAFSDPEGQGADDTAENNKIVGQQEPLMNRRAMEAARRREEEEAAAKAKAEKQARKQAKKDALRREKEEAEQRPFLGDDHDVEVAERNRRRLRRKEKAEAKRKERREGEGNDEDGDGADDLDVSISSLGSFDAFDPSNAEKMRKRLARIAAASSSSSSLITAAGNDPRIIYNPPIDRIPTWVHRWSDLRLFTDVGQHQRDKGDPFDTVSAAVVRQLQADISAVEELIREISLGTEGGFGEPSSRQCEDQNAIELSAKHEKLRAQREQFLKMAAIGTGLGAETSLLNTTATASFKKAAAPRKPAPDRWKFPNAAMEHAMSLRADLQQKLAILMNSLPVGLSPTEGADGLQFSSLPRANVDSIEKILFRATMEELFAGDRLGIGAMYDTTNNQRDRTLQTRKLERNVRIENALSKVPIIHKEFLVDDDGPRMHAEVLNFPDMLTPPIGREASSSGAVGTGKLRRSIVININYLRLHNSERFTKEHEAASEFLDAYERYRLLASNQAPGVKSRRFYEQMLRSIEGEVPPHPYLSVVQELYTKTCEMESSCLKAMVKAWQQICAARAENAAAAAAVVGRGGSVGGGGDGVGTASTGGTVAVNMSNNMAGNSSASASAQQQSSLAAQHTRLDFSLARVGETEATTFNERVDNILDFVPVVTDVSTFGGPHQAGQAFSVALHAQLSSSQPLQRVGITDKQKLNTLFTAVFKESFELLTTHDPVRFTAVVLDGKGAVLASVDVPASLTHAQHLLEFKTQIQYNTPEGPRPVTGVISLSTNWTTVAGLTIEDIEKKFMKGEADPMDPRNDAMVRILGKYYIEQSIAARREKTAAAAETAANKRVGGGEYASALSVRTHNRLRATWDSFQPSELTQAEDAFFNSETYKLTNMTPKMRLTLRQQMLQKRWRISKGIVLAANAAEAKLVDTPIPAGDVHAERMMMDMIQKEKILAREAANKAAADVVAKKEGVVFAKSITSTSGAVMEASTSAAAASSHGKSATISEWQQRIRNMKMTQAKKKRLRDHEIQAQILILPTIPTPEKIIKKFLRWFNPRSPLNPEREDRLSIDVIRAKREQKVDDSRIIVHVMKASNLPGRDGSDASQQVMYELEPFIVANFIGSEAQTRVESGVSPAFFQSLELQFQPDNFEESTLSLIADDVCISFYDKVQVSLPPSTMPRSANANVTHFRLERRFLGIVKIPFYSLFESETASLEGEFDIVMPRVISGYTRPKETPSVHLFVSLYPAISKAKEVPETAQETLSRLFTQPMTRDLYELYMAAVSWRNSCRVQVKAVLAANPLAKRREIEPFVNNSKGDLAFVCRYLSEVGAKPPPTVTDAGTAVRFVSLLPFVVDMIAWNDEQDVWSTLSEFLAMGAGDYEELAMLLAMLLRHLEPNEQTFLLLGIGRVFKQATFVLHTNGDNVNIIDPRTGCIYSIENPNIPMEEVSMVVSHDQVWANVQLSGAPHRMVWNFGDRRYWAPMLSPALQPVMARVPSVQRHSLEYEPIPKNAAYDMEELVRREVKKALKAWRNDRQPTLQQRVGTILREVLVEFEKERCEHANVAQTKCTQRHLQAMGEFSAQYEAVGVPVNVGYKDSEFSELLMQLYETRVHELGTDNALFGLGVYVKAYTGTVFSIWVYLVGLVPRDPHSRL